MNILTDMADQERVFLLDGALGTELERRGYPTQLPLWSAGAIRQAPEMILAIHQDFIDAGADIITTNTFRTTYYTYAKCGASGVDQDITLAVELGKQARGSAQRRVYVATSLAPMEDCYKPELAPPESELRDFHASQIAALANADPDLLLVETMISQRELEVLLYLLPQTQLPVIFSLTTDQDGTLLDGTRLADCVATLKSISPLAIMLNCRPLDTIDSALAVLRSKYDGAIGAYANGHGHAGGETGWIWEQHSDLDRVYCDHAATWLDLGAKIIGGCCGTTPSVIAGLRTLIDARS